jgi:hypothetical protein
MVLALLLHISLAASVPDRLFVELRSISDLEQALFRLVARGFLLFRSDFSLTSEFVLLPSV